MVKVCSFCHISATSTSVATSDYGEKKDSHFMEGGLDSVVVEESNSMLTKLDQASPRMGFE